MPWIQHMVELDLSMDKESRPKTIKDIGEKIYKSNCALCHGQDRKGNTSGSYPSLVNVKDRISRDELITILKNGQGFMPSFSQLSNDKNDALIAFLFDEQVNNDKKKLFDSYVDSLLNEMKENSFPYTHTGYNRFFDEEGYPAVKPPWGTLNAIDLNKGEILWQVPLGEFEELTKRGIPKTGTENYGGPVVTASGLIFIAGTMDEHIRAFDKDTGEEIWKHKLPAGGYATPSVYEVNGKQYVAIACGGGKMGTKPGDYYLAFALP